MHYLRFENANRGEGSINKIFENKSENEPHKHQKYIYISCMWAKEIQIS